MESLKTTWHSLQMKSVLGGSHLNFILVGYFNKNSNFQPRSQGLLRIQNGGEKPVSPPAPPFWMRRRPWERGWVMFISLYQVVVTFESVDEILKCDHSNESYWAVLSCGAVYYAAQGGSNFWVCGWNPKVWPFKWKLLSSTFLWCCFIVLYKGVLAFELVGEILKWTIQWKLLSSTFLWCSLLRRTRLA